MVYGTVINSLMPEVGQVMMLNL